MQRLQRGYEAQTVLCQLMLHSPDTWCTNRLPSRPPDTITLPAASNATADTPPPPPTAAGACRGGCRCPPLLPSLLLMMAASAKLLG
jgi:hypothetical protein